MPRRAYWPVTFVAVLGQLHQAEVGEPEAGEVGGLAFGGRAGRAASRSRRRAGRCLIWNWPVKALPEGSSVNVASPLALPSLYSHLRSCP